MVHYLGVTWYLPSSLSSKKQLYMLFSGIFEGVFLFKSHLNTVTPFVIFLFCFILQISYKYSYAGGL